MIEVKKLLKVRNPDTKEFETLLAIKGEKGDKGDKGDMPALSTEVGDSETIAASQKLVTEVEGRVTAVEALASQSATDIATLQGTMTTHLNESLKAVYGSYTGDGKHASKTFEFPSLNDVLFLVITRTSDDSRILYIKGADVAYAEITPGTLSALSSTQYYVYITVNGSDITMKGRRRSGSDASEDDYSVINSGTYHYFAIGV